MQMQRVVSTEHVLSAELRRSEKLIWSGRPRQGVFLTQRDAGMIPFSLMWGGFSFFWEFKAVSSGGPLFFDLWGVPFVLVGLYMIVGRFFYEAEKASGTGTVTFGPDMSYSGRGSSAGRNPQPSFESIADAREVFERICSTRRGA